MEYYPRIIEKKLEPWIKRKQAILVRGPKQVGKTTLFLHLKEKLEKLFALANLKAKIIQLMPISYVCEIDNS
ncbi:ATP-binding protein [bacterium]|nr:ATP-binding protein [bacterium]